MSIWWSLSWRNISEPLQCLTTFQTALYTQVCTTFCISDHEFSKDVETEMVLDWQINTDFSVLTTNLWHYLFENTWKKNSFEISFNLLAEATRFGVKTFCRMPKMPSIVSMPIHLQWFKAFLNFFFFIMTLLDLCRKATHYFVLEDVSDYPW